MSGNSGTADATKCYTPLQRAGLTVAQENALDALASGKNDTEAAALVGVHRVTLTRWRLYHPGFQAALNQRRQTIWAASIDRLRGLVPLALDAVADELGKTDSPDRLKTALGLLKLVPLTVAAPAGPTEADEIVAALVKERRRNTRGQLDDVYEDGKQLPRYDEHLKLTWVELNAKLEATATEQEVV